MQSTSLVLGNDTNNKKSWNRILTIYDFKHIINLAYKVFNSLSLGSDHESDKDDLVQEAIYTLYLNSDSWDSTRSFSSWASVVIRNSILRSLRLQHNNPIPYDPHKLDYVSDDESYEKILDSQEALSHYINANKKERQVFNKVIGQEPLTRNDYYILEQYREKLNE